MKVNGLFLLLLLLLSSLSTSIDKLDVGRFNQHVGGEYWMHMEEQDALPYAQAVLTLIEEPALVVKAD